LKGKGRRKGEKRCRRKIGRGNEKREEKARGRGKGWTGTWKKRVKGSAQRMDQEERRT
jgi:hypothetical protein